MKEKEKRIKVIWDDEAKKSLRSVYDHIKDRESVRVARRVRTEILNKVKSLVAFPDKFKKNLT